MKLRPYQQEVAKYNLEYRQFVEAEKGRLGENHPLFRTQYALLPISGSGVFLSRANRFAARHAPEA